MVEVLGDRGQLEHYGRKDWIRKSSPVIGKAVHRAISLMSYVLAPLHRNYAKEGSEGINTRLIVGDNG